MRSPHTRGSGWASIAAVALAATQVLVLAEIDTRYLVVAAGVLVLITVFSAFKLCRDNCVESRVVLASVAVASALSIALNTTIGLPGVPPHPIDGPGGAMLTAALLVLLAIAAEARPRHAVARSGSPYAI